MIPNPPGPVLVTSSVVVQPEPKQGDPGLRVLTHLRPNSAPQETAWPEDAVSDRGSAFDAGVLALMPRTETAERPARDGPLQEPIQPLQKRRLRTDRRKLVGPGQEGSGEERVSARRGRCRGWLRRRRARYTLPDVALGLQTRISRGRTARAGIDSSWFTGSRSLVGSSESPGIFAFGSFGGSSLRAGATDGQPSVRWVCGPESTVRGRSLPLSTLSSVTGLVCGCCTDGVRLDGHRLPAAESNVHDSANGPRVGRARIGAVDAGEHQR
jgi:hypothetical protein